MAEQRLTQQVVLTTELNANAKARLTQLAFITVEVNANGSARLTQIPFLSLVVNTNTNARLTQLVWLTIVPALADSCARPWTIPTPAAFPIPSVSGIQYTYFDELEPDWGNFGQQFPDLAPAFNTIQTARVRRFIFEWQGLDEAQCAVLDAHWESTRGGLPFTLTHPRTAEVISGVRYEQYERTPHRRVWSQSRAARLVKYTN